MSSPDPEPRPPLTLVGKIDNALAILLIIGMAYGVFWLLSSLASSYIGLFT
ncbi:hypothetical protein HUT19_34925 [Streptomyces sp. NA02950]|uniref:hypothetical protein n=1 Tax=Streptomyces sp. NA02950 TaxID=2742137 RepID=UPI0015918409|nr:hypothetical protein [Streptomyces sp. NA02950]QKV96276.1 hypothetical protein HUT19_34925 [Streptomyces sp. NA02950]